MTYPSLINQLKTNPLLSENIVFWQDQLARTNKMAEFPDWVDSVLVSSLRKKIITSLYSHQREAIDLIHSGKNVVITTGTASGKSLCYQLPILDGLIKGSHSTALLFFPTKALTYDQLKSFSNLALECRLPIEQQLIGVYDGDTPSTQRSLIRKNARILLTNPDMLNIGILPHHTSWAHFFENLKFIVIDEIHLYRGVFGSHIANLLRRIKRICNFYGAHPQFVMNSATIANPVELASNLIEDDVSEIAIDGSPKGDKSFLIYNPPLINEELGIREGVLSSSSKLSSAMLYHDVQSLVFCETRRFVELMLREIQNSNPILSNKIRGYRSGYLKKDRREIEEGLKNRQLKMVVATNALELGVDIGGIDAILMAGFPGSISSLRQRMGRSGRSLAPSISILVTSMNPLDQFMARNPQYLLEKPLERALINPNNPLILLPHIKSAAFELPFQENASFGRVNWDELEEYLDYLCDEGVLQRKRDKYYWLSETYPSNNYSLRSTISDQVLIQYDDGEEIKTIGEVDYNSSLWMVHPGAVYLQDGFTYYVKDLNLEQNIATVTDHQSDYYTEPLMSQEIEILSTSKTEEKKHFSLQFGELEVTSSITGFRKVQNQTREVLSIETLDLPLLVLQTAGLWITLNPKCIAKMRAEGVWLSDPNDYGKDWNRTREIVRRRDHFTCQSCGKVEEGIMFHVHHKVPFKSFVSLERANKLDNLITLCPICHRLAELNIRMRSALSGIKYLMSQLAPLLVLCEQKDLGSVADPNAKFADMNPSVLIYDAIPAGIGLSSSLYDQTQELFLKCLQLTEECQCQDGCPSCVGPVSEQGTGGKKETIYLLKLLLDEVN